MIIRGKGNSSIIINGSVSGTIVNGDLIKGGQNAAGNRIIGSGKEKTENRSTSAFSELYLVGPIDVEFVRSEHFDVKVRGDDNLVQYVSVEHRGATLHLGFTHDVSFSTSAPLRVLATGPTVDAVHIVGSGDVQLRDLKQPHLSIAIQGSGDVEADGRVDRLDVGINGSGDVDAAELEAANVTVRISGSGDVEVNATTSINAMLNGSGDLRVHGEPSGQHVVANGSGDVKFRSAKPSR